MATPKQVREVYRRIEYHHAKLMDALIDAHNMKVIQYDENSETWYRDQSACKTGWETKSRYEKATEKALAQAMREEIRKGIK